MNNIALSIEVENGDYSIYSGMRLVAWEIARGDKDWNDRVEKAIELVRLAGGNIRDNRRRMEVANG